MLVQGPRCGDSPCVRRRRAKHPRTRSRVGPGRADSYAGGQGWGGDTDSPTMQGGMGGESRVNELERGGRESEGGKLATDPPCACAHVARAVAAASPAGPPRRTAWTRPYIFIYIYIYITDYMYIFAQRGRHDLHAHAERESAPTTRIAPARVWPRARARRAARLQGT